MRLLRYCRLVIQTAVKHSVDWAQAIVFLMTIALWATTFIEPRLAWHVNLGAGNVLGVILGSLILMRLLFAPYWIYVDQEGKLKKLTEDLERERKHQAQGAAEIVRYRASERESHIIPLSSNTFKVLFHHRMRVTPSVRFIEPKDESPLPSDFSEWGFTVAFPYAKQEIKRIRFEANANP